jgi:hypothetical protein
VTSRSVLRRCLQSRNVGGRVVNSDQTACSRPTKSMALTKEMTITACSLSPEGHVSVWRLSTNESQRELLVDSSITLLALDQHNKAVVISRDTGNKFHRKQLSRACGEQHQRSKEKQTHRQGEKSPGCEQ